MLYRRRPPANTAPGFLAALCLFLAVAAAGRDGGQKPEGIGEDTAAFGRIKTYLNERYVEGEGTRADMVRRLVAFADAFPGSPLADQALFQAASLHTQHRVRETGEEPYDAKAARKLHVRIVERSPDLLTCWVVWSRHELACLYDNADDRLKGRASFYGWLRNITPKQRKATIREMRREKRFAHTSEENLADRISGLLQATVDSVEKNVIADARSCTDPAASLRHLRDSFSKTKLAQMATAALAEQE